MFGPRKRTEVQVIQQPVARMIRLIPLAMVIPNALGVYSLSSYQEPLLVTEAEWYTYTPTPMKVGTPGNWREVTAYGKGLSGWYIAVEA